MTMYTLIDRTNARTVSRHRSLAAAAHARERLLRATARRHGRGSYIDTAILDADGERIDHHSHPDHDCYTTALDAVRSGYRVPTMLID